MNMHHNSESEARGDSGPIRRTQSMPQQAVAAPPQHSLRRVATATPVAAAYPVSYPSPFSLAYPNVNYSPNRDTYFGPTVGGQNHHSPIDQQRDQLEMYRRNRRSTSSASSNNSSVHSIRDAEARELEEAIALSLIESTRQTAQSRPLSLNGGNHRYGANSVISAETDLAERTLLETTHMTPEELADERALQEAIRLSICDAALEQERILSSMSSHAAHERSASTQRVRHSHPLEQPYVRDAQHCSASTQRAHQLEQKLVSNAHVRSGSTHRVHSVQRNHVNEHFPKDYPKQHHMASREEPNPVHHERHHHHDTRHYHREERASQHPAFGRRDSYGYDVHEGAPTYDPFERVDGKTLTRLPSPYSSRSTSENSSVVDDNSKVSAVPAVPTGRAPPPVFGHATLRAPPPLAAPDLLHSGVKHQ